jgi:DNA-binding beta-propeller fold protein YncE
MRSKTLTAAISLVVSMIVAMAAGASPALAEPHPFLGPLGGSSSPDTFTNPNGIAIDEASGDVYVADIGTNKVYKFEANGAPVELSALHSNALSGPPGDSFSFPSERGTPAAIAVDNSSDPSDPSRGDLYVMDAGHDVIDKFSSDGTYLSQITGPFEEGPIGVAVMTNGDLRVAVRSHTEAQVLLEKIDLFDNAAANDLIKQQEGGVGTEANFDPSSRGGPPGYGFAIDPRGDYYNVFGCGCTEKFGGALTALGRVDSGSGDVAIAVDPASGHLYVDDQSSVAEWDTGELDGYDHLPDSSEDVPTGALLSSFGSMQLSATLAEQGGLAVNGATGTIYISNPSDGKVYMFDSAAPAVAADTATGVTQTAATLRGSVDPRGMPATSCGFEYQKAPKGGEGEYAFSIPVTTFSHRVACAQPPAQIGAGTPPVGVSAEIGGLAPGVLYYFRLVAGNADGSSQSEGMVATESSGFGVSSFGVSFLNQDGTPDIQAGSHPYEMVTTFDFNLQTVQKIPYADSPYRLRPVGNARDIILTLPPGFVGDPGATAKKCKLTELLEPGEGGFYNVGEKFNTGCPHEAKVGELYLETGGYGTGSFTLNNMVPPRGVAAQLGTRVIFPNAFINVGPEAGGQYPLQSESLEIPAIVPLYRIRASIRGVVGSGSSRKPFLTLPSGCTGPLWSSISVDSYQHPGQYVGMREPTRNASSEDVRLSGCSKLTFPTGISAAPDVSDTSSSSGLTVGVRVPQTAAFNPDGLAESALRDTTVALPPGVTINPAGAGGLQACSEGLSGFAGFTEFNQEYESGVKWATFSPAAIESLQPGVSFCPDESKIGTVKIETPLLEQPLEGAVYLASQDTNPFGSLIAMYMMVEDPVAGATIKLTGEVRLCEAAGQVIEGVSCQGLGQIVTTFKNTPDLPFENLELHFFGGERAPLATPSRCGTYNTTAVFTPWDGNSPVTAESSFNIEHGPSGGPCVYPGQALPFNPTVTGGATNIQAGAFSPLTVTVNRKDGEQNLKSLEAKLPPGLSGVLTGVEQCPEPQANEGLCGEDSKVGEATIGVGVGNDPFTVTGGKFYLTGPYNGHGSCTVGEAGCAPFGLTFEVPAKAGPFDLANTTNNHPACDCVVVRGKIELDPQTAAITITSNPPGSPDSIPTSIEGIPLEIQHVNATTTRGDFQFNPTNCSKMSLTGTVQLNEGGTSTISTPFQVTNCAALKFEPKFTVSTSAKTSRTAGASLSAKLAYPSVPQGTDADIAKVKVELPKQLPSRLTTLQKACTAAQFESNPAACPTASKIGYATVHTPLIPVPLQGPAIFVSHGGEAFPSLTLVLQGYGITIDLVGTTDIKSGVTSTTFKTVPDQPFSSFELTLPEGPYSALTAPGNLCTAKNLTMPTEFLAQNGAELEQNTKITVTGCAKHKAVKHKKKHHTHKAKRKTKHKRKAAT